MLNNKLEEENCKPSAHQGRIEKEWIKAVRIRERQAITMEHQLASFKQQQFQVAKILKRTLVKLKETKAELDAALINASELSEQLTEARQETVELRAFYHLVHQIVAESQNNQNLKEELLVLIGNISSEILNSMNGLADLLTDKEQGI